MKSSKGALKNIKQLGKKDFVYCKKSLKQSMAQSNKNFLSTKILTQIKINLNIICINEDVGLNYSATGDPVTVAGPGINPYSS